jgi:hypothetical protein
VLNGAGKATFSITKNDPHATAANLRYGNPILIEHDRAGAWGGFIDTPRPWGSDTLQVTAWEAPRILRSRRPVTPGEFTMSPGEAFKEIIRQANASEDTLIRANDSEIYSGGSSRTVRFKYVPLYDFLARLASSSGSEWAFEPDVSSGLLTFQANWYERRGVDRNWNLEEGKNIKRIDGTLLNEQGDIINDCLVFVRAPAGGDFETAKYEDAASIAKYGRRQAVVSATEVHGSQKMAQAIVTAHSEPLRTYSGLAVIDVNGDFDKVQLGDTVWLRLPNYGFTESDSGTRAQIRIIGRAFDDALNELQIVADEVTV